MSGKAKERRRKRRARAQAATARQRTPGQRQARDELLALTDHHPYLLSATDLHVGKGEFHARVRIDTSAIDRVETGVPVANDHEDVELWFDGAYPNRPPTVLVTHDRFLGHPHVLVGRILCIYLDTDREWHPALGASGVVARLVEWLEDAAADRFDARTALFHPIGGLPPSPRTVGTIVIRQPNQTPTRPHIGRATINLRSPHRVDLVHWSHRTADDPPSTTEALVLRTSEPMPYGLVGAGTLGDLLARVQHANGPAANDAIASALRLITRIGKQPLRIIVDVAHPTEPHLSFLASAQAAATIPPAVARQPQLIDQLPELPIGWTNVSDERPEVAARRDAQRPTSAFTGSSVELWGCGGLGSWMAEFIARAGASRITLRDTGAVSGGLLVRQNYLEDDIGLSKADQLASRLRAVSDDIDIQSAPANALDLLTEGYTTDADLLIDATINVTVAARLDEWRRKANSAPHIAQVATDPRTATLGLLIVASPDLAVGPATIDDATWMAIRDNPATERFHGFWTPPTKSDQLVPALGCSTPTFHGSAADLACLAGSLVSLLAAHLNTTTSGAHLVESSHARGPEGGGHHFIGYP